MILLSLLPKKKAIMRLKQEKKITEDQSCNIPCTVRRLCVRVIPLFAICALVVMQLLRSNAALSEITPKHLDIPQTTLPQQKKQGKYAVAFVIAGCSWKEWNSMDSCVPYVLNAIVAAHVLRKFQSSIDVVLKVRMAASSDETSFAELSPEIEEWLSKVGVKLSYLPKVRLDNFGTTTIELFRTLEMVEYDRVLFMDSDSYLVCNIDRHFDLSFNGLVDETVAFTGGAAPITASALMVTPKLGAFGQVMDIIHRYRDSSKSKTKLDPIQGWGHPIVNEKGDVVKEWNWYAVNGDQGVLYEWLMHELKNFTLISNNLYLTYREVVDVTPNFKSVHKNSTNHMISFCANKTEPWILTCPGGDGTGKPSSKGTLSQTIHHFSGGFKPWGQGGITVNTTEKRLFSELSARDKWRYYLSEANRTYSLNLPSRIKMTAKHPSGGGIGPNVLLSPDVEIPVPIGNQD